MINPDKNHEYLLKKIQPKLSKKLYESFEEGKNEIEKKFLELVGIENIEKNICPLNFKIEIDEDRQDYRFIRFTFESEYDEIVPCYLLIPKLGKEKYPVAITLQGHTTGFHVSIGKSKFEGDEKYQPRNAFALQAVENGFIALAIEQRGLGERKTQNERLYGGQDCRHASMVAIHLGRTLIGERIWDIKRGIDVLEKFPECDLDKILITGNSGGGTASYYAACYDKRIKLCVPSCSVCTYKDSILSLGHCTCNYIPFAYQNFEMADLACMIAPRKLILQAGKKDTIFPIEGVRTAFSTITDIYRNQNADDNCRLIETEEGHAWCDDLIWPAIKFECNKLGW